MVTDGIGFFNNLILKRLSQIIQETSNVEEEDKKKTVSVIRCEKNSTSNRLFLKINWATSQEFQQPL